MCFPYKNYFFKNNYSICPSRFLAEASPVLKDIITGEKQKLNKTYTSCVHGTYPGKLKAEI